MIHYKQGNILHEQTQAIVNTVNTVGVMGKGLALQFKKAFPGNFEVYKKACDDKLLSTGQVLSVPLNSMNPPHYVINFPTKAHWKSPSKLEYIESGLDALKQEVKRLNIQSVALPALGSGLGGLEWGEVDKIIQKKLSDMPDVDWQVFAPQMAPAAKDMPDNTTRPKMTAGRAAVLSLINQYLSTGFLYELTLLEVQKLVYFLTAAGEHLNQVKFTKHHYGPYADVLRHVLNRIEGHFISGYADGKNAPDTSITLLPDAVNSAASYLQSHTETLNKFEQVADLVEGYESPYGMELLSTVHWVATQEANDKTNSDEVIQLVHNWSPRKANMKPAHIKAALSTLENKGWLTKLAQV